MKSGHYEVRYKQSHDWPLAFTTVVLTMNGEHDPLGARRVGAVAPIAVAIAAAEAALAGKPLNEQTAAAAGEAASQRSEADERQRLQGSDRTRTAVKRALMHGCGIEDRAEFGKWVIWYLVISSNVYCADD